MIDEERKNTSAAEDTHHAKENCDAIEDPVRRGLCKMCGMPVVGSAPFCIDHEPPVPS
jgi:hypothetical protein